LFGDPKRSELRESCYKGIIKTGGEKTNEKNKKKKESGGRHRKILKNGTKTPIGTKSMERTKKNHRK